MLLAYVLVALAALVQSVLLAIQTWEHRRYTRRRLGDGPLMKPIGRVRVLAPCKGLDVDLEQNLRRLFEQDYDDYELTFIVESASDPACRTIRRLIDEYPRVRAEVVVAGCATSSGQKVHNLLAATARLPEGIEYLAFVDSDAQPRPFWLRMLVSRLARAEVGATTGYRWFLPARMTLPNCLVYAINCGVMVLLGRRSYYFVWGGSWAIHRERFESLGIRRAWEGTLSDDLVAGRQLRNSPLETRFDPAAVVGSPLDLSWRDMLSFMRRQYMVARFYTPRWWALSLASSTLTSLAWLATVGMAAASLAPGGPPAWIPVGLGAMLYVASTYRGWVRQDVGRLHFAEQHDRLRWPSRFDVWLSPLVSLANWAALLSSTIGRHIVWRGNCYRLHRGGRVTLVGDAVAADGAGAESIDARPALADPSVQPAPTIRTPHARRPSSNAASVLERKGLRADGPHLGRALGGSRIGEPE